MYVIQDDQSLPAKELTPNQAKSLSSKLAQSILKSLSHKPTYPKQIAKIFDMQI